MLPQEVYVNLILSFNACTHKKLQKLCYYVYSWYMAIYDEKIANIKFEAWVHGPVSPDIYHSYKRFGWLTIPKYNGYLPVSKNIYLFVEAVLNEYSKYEANKLESITHMESPWIFARRGHERQESCSELIEDRHIISYYRNHPLYQHFQSYKN